MDETPNLALPLLAAAQAQKHVTHNEALLALDALLHCTVASRTVAVPPVAPVPGHRAIVPAGATGAWAGHPDAIASFEEGAGWRFFPPAPGMLAYVADEGQLCLRAATAWVPLGSALGAVQNLARLGLGTAADATNPFAAKLNKALWTARTVAEGGDGDLRYTLNKELSSDVGSLLFQTGFSGRLEFGLIGSDSPALKVSPDGATWRNALTVEPASGGVDFLCGSTELASAATVDLGAAPTRRVTITGTTTVTSFGTAPNRERLIRFASALTLTYDAAALVLPGKATLAVAAGDMAYATSDADGRWTVRHYTAVAQPPGRATIVAQALGASGYRRWSDGFIEQWGFALPSGGVATVVFPTAFTSQVDSVVFAVFGNGVTNTNMAFQGWASSTSTTGMATQHRYWTGSGFAPAGEGAWWRAIGR